VTILPIIPRKNGQVISIFEIQIQDNPEDRRFGLGRSAMRDRFEKSGVHSGT